MLIKQACEVLINSQFSNVGRNSAYKHFDENSIYKVSNCFKTAKDIKFDNKQACKFQEFLFKMLGGTLCTNFFMKYSCEKSQ